MLRHARATAKTLVVLLFLFLVLAPALARAEWKCFDERGWEIRPDDRKHGCPFGSHWEHPNDDEDRRKCCWNGGECVSEDTEISDKYTRSTARICDDGNPCSIEQVNTGQNICLCENAEDGPAYGCAGPRTDLDGGLCNTQTCIGGMCVVIGAEDKPSPGCSGKVYDCAIGTEWKSGCCRTVCTPGLAWNEENACCWDANAPNDIGGTGACVRCTNDAQGQCTVDTGGKCVFKARTPRNQGGASVYQTCDKVDLPTTSPNDDDRCPSGYRLVRGETNRCAPVLQTDGANSKTDATNWQSRISSNPKDPAVESLGVCRTTTKIICGDGIQHDSENSNNCCTDTYFPADNPNTPQDERKNFGYCSPDGDGERFCVNNECIKPVVIPEANFDQEWENWLPIMTMAVLIGYFIAALAFMASSLFNMPDLWAWAKAEVGEVSASAWFTGGGVGLAVIVNEIVKTVGCGAYSLDGSCPYFTHASIYLDRLGGELLGILGIGLSGSLVTGLLSYFGLIIPIPIPIGPVTITIQAMFTPFYGLNVVTQLIAIASNMTAFALFSVIAQKVLLEFIAQTMFSVFLPVGIVLRCFSLTRRMGSTIMAFAVGLYVVYPLTLVMNDWIYYQGSVGRLEAGTVEGDFPFTASDMMDFISPFFGPDFAACSGLGWPAKIFCWIFEILFWAFKVVISLIMLIVMQMVALYYVFASGPGDFTASFLDQYLVIIPVAVQSMIPAFAFPVLDLIIVITAIRSLSPAIGGEIRVFGLMEFA